MTLCFHEKTVPTCSVSANAASQTPVETQGPLYTRQQDSLTNLSMFNNFNKVVKMCCTLAVNHFTVKSVDFLAKSSSVQTVRLQPDLE